MLIIAMIIMMRAYSAVASPLWVIRIMGEVLT